MTKGPHESRGPFKKSDQMFFENTMCLVFGRDEFVILDFETQLVLGLFLGQ